MIYSRLSPEGERPVDHASDPLKVRSRMQARPTTTISVLNHTARTSFPSSSAAAEPTLLDSSAVSLPVGSEPLAPALRGQAQCPRGHQVRRSGKPTAIADRPTNDNKRKKRLSAPRKNLGTENHSLYIGGSRTNHVIQVHDVPHPNSRVRTPSPRGGDLPREATPTNSHLLSARGDCRTFAIPTHQPIEESTSRHNAPTPTRRGISPPGGPTAKQKKELIRG